VQIDVCDLTASCTFRWHHRRARGMAAIDELVQLLVLRTSSAANGATENSRWKREYEQGRDRGELLDAIEGWICQTQMPIYWDVYSMQAWEMAPVTSGSHSLEDRDRSTAGQVQPDPVGVLLPGAPKP